MPTEITQVNETETSTVENEGTKVDTPSIETKVEEKPYKSFATQADFDRHSVGIKNSVRKDVEKEILAQLGLKADEKDKLAKFKKAYEDTLSESEKQAKTLESLSDENASLKNLIAEKEAIIMILTKLSNNKSINVNKMVKMAKGLIDEETTMEQALDYVIGINNKSEEKNTIPKGTPISETASKKVDNNPFKTGNLTEQGKLIKSDRELAREYYTSVYGKAPSW